MNKILKYNFILICSLLIVSFQLIAQKNKESSQSIKNVIFDWKGTMEMSISVEQSEKVLYFEGANYDLTNNFLPVFNIKNKLLNDISIIEVQLVNAFFVALSAEETRFVENENLSDKIQIHATVSYSKKTPYANISFIPIRKNNLTGIYEKLISCDIVIIPTILNKKYSNIKKSLTNNSVLSTGIWYKIGVVEDGIYQLSYTYLKNLGIDVNTINPKNIRIYGNGGGMLPFNNSDFRYDDVEENAVYVFGEDDNIFDKEDYVLFYGQSPHRWYWDKSSQKFQHQLYLYSDTTFYYITIDLGLGKRIQNQLSEQTYNTTVTSFNDYFYYEKEQTNFLQSGRGWFGEYFDIATSYDFVFTFPNIITSEEASLKTVVAARTEGTGYQSAFKISVSGQASDNIAISGVGTYYLNNYVNIKSNTIDFMPTSSLWNINLKFNKGLPNAIGWLDYLEANVRRELQMEGGQMSFRDMQSVDSSNIANFVLSRANKSIIIWDVSNPINVKQQETALIGNQIEFNVSNNSLREFIAFDGTSYLIPKYYGIVPNQNLHASEQKDMIIVTHPLFLNEANDLAQWHEEKDSLSVIVATTTQIYNEFSSGAQDITAIKDFVKMFYDRAGSDTSLFPKYLLLFGDGSYDNKNRISGNTNFIPTYQSANSYSPTVTYVSDDYYGLLDDNEGENITDLVDIGIGRLPVKSVEEARGVVNKIKRYYNQSTMKPWRNYLCFIGDDEDGNLHMRDADDLAKRVQNSNPEYNINKIYLDAYKQTSSAGGERYPDAHDEINRMMQKGALIINYVGHGGELGWAHERILEVRDIINWSNIDNMPLFLTATCEFSRYDDPQRTSAGEKVFLNPNGGGIGLLTTTRVVYSGENKNISNAFYNNVFKEINNKMPRMGDVIRMTKMEANSGTNNRKFTLLGDPAVRLAYPYYDVVTNSISDTIKALNKVSVTGYVCDKNGQKMNDFNGIIYPTVFDKASTITTLKNDKEYEGDIITFTFQFQKNILFKGKASVKDGDFSFSFVVPKDISYNYGNGRISYYAENGTLDANGFFDDFVIGGFADSTNMDKKDPDIQLYLNNEDFVFGGVTNEKPKMIAYIYDENGINTVGNGIGHDVTAVLDYNTSQALILNDYYESDLDSFQRGSITYPFTDLKEGKHSLELKVWDNYNNSGTAYTEFVVAKSAELALNHVLNYPNPFTTRTQFFFEHNQPGQMLQVRIQIFTVSGKLIKTMDEFMSSDGFRSQPIVWNGLDDYGDKIGRGVYIYRLKVTPPNGKFIEKYEKLVILN